MLQKTDDKALNIQATKNKRNYNTLAVASNTNGANSTDGASDAIGRVGGNIENLSIAAKLAKNKKRKMTKTKN